MAGKQEAGSGNAIGGSGIGYGVAAYGIWGLFPLFWPLLEPSSAVDILANRMTWSLVAVALLLLVQRKWAWIRPLLAQPRRLALSVLAAMTISVNWGVYIWGVNSGHVVETSLGYFINPLVTIAFGVLLLRERLRTAQWVAVGVGVAAVVVLTVGYGRPPWIALTLAFSFGTYGLLKKKVALGGQESFALESAVMFPFAVGFLIWQAVRGEGSFGVAGWGHSGLLMVSGVITAIPLLCFGAAALRVPLSTLGLLQYLAPVLQFLLGITVFHEQMPPARWAGFALVWVALVMLSWDALRRLRQNRAAVLTPRPAVADAPQQALSG
ncbi:MULTISPECIES: EamA family transporter RarD [unclassified Kitasatospora]|uniref:EamA family transporter RarD n=1 Tax=unclassified Kitasatospora TaxID=2633591 RepID=UPI00070FFE9E|nr:MULTISPECIES: EamA family transporter RarD [unclassified Kitasatospora]KQV24311.1 protein rarD [Kitasatospora sp. Root107]KRB67641.1 protein rarD [Kitasatospora sp. Root187]